MAMDTSKFPWMMWRSVFSWLQAKKKKVREQVSSHEDFDWTLNLRENSKRRNSTNSSK